jgi:hypothetical protein
MHLARQDGVRCSHGGGTVKVKFSLRLAAPGPRPQPLGWTGAMELWYGASVLRLWLKVRKALNPYNACYVQLARIRRVLRDVPHFPWTPPRVLVVLTGRWLLDRIRFWTRVGQFASRRRLRGIATLLDHL